MLCPSLNSVRRKIDYHLLSSKPRAYTQCTHTFHPAQDGNLWVLFRRTRGHKSLPARPKTASPFLIYLALKERTHTGLSALNTYMGFFLCDLKVPGLMEVGLWVPSCKTKNLRVCSFKSRHMNPLPSSLNSFHQDSLGPWVPSCRTIRTHESLPAGLKTYESLPGFLQD